MIGTILGHFRILEKLGAGGMGEVYRARDERLDRDVALKVLPPSTLADEDARKRFRKEALALSKLNHSNIATIFDFDTDVSSPGGVDFLVMELVDGESLAEKIAGRALAEKEVAALGAQVADALEDAHEHGVVHRDLKPANILVTAKSRVKVLDFGLAKLLRPAGPTEVTASLTATPAAAGTLPYMAPEQLQGDAVDARADIYSLGAVLYEMATGRRAFREEISTRLIDAILNRAPVSPRAVEERVSPELERMILKCLEKDPAKRYQSAKEIAVDLRRLGSPATASAMPTVAPARSPRGKSIFVIAGAGVLLLAAVAVLNMGGWRQRLMGPGASARIESLAVLPLDNLSRDPAEDYFADGMTEELTADLGQIGALRVISRTSVMQYKGARKKTMPEIGRELNVDALVEGSVRRAGQRVRITAQLIRAATDQHLWAKSYEGDLGDVLTLQSQVAGEIASEIKIALTPQNQARLATARKVNPEAYELYLRGNYLTEQPRGAWWRGDDLKKAIFYYQQAIDKDPSYPLAYVGVANAYITLVSNGWVSSNEAYFRARAAALKALELDGSLADAHCALGGVLDEYDWDWLGAEREYRKAIELNPSLRRAHGWLALLLSWLGRHEEAIAEAREAQRLDPLLLTQKVNGGYILLRAGRLDEALTQCRMVLDLEPDYAPALACLGSVYLQQGKNNEAVSAFQKAQKLSPEYSSSLTRLGKAYAQSGNRSEALRVLQELKEMSKTKYVSPCEVAAIYIGLGEKDQAIAWLEKAYKERDPRLTQIKGSPEMAPLGSDPRFQDLLRRMNFPQ